MLYSQTSPGWWASGSFDNLVTISAELWLRSVTFAAR